MLQFKLSETHTRDPWTGLLYHGWDEKRPGNGQMPKPANPQSSGRARWDGMP
ncbi:MAG: hypothetical protein U5R06_02040 [candidate division KSB1 bacterium]|nr:hypothetical protein [candidate division KSB1 bacterium]